jgi:hypothetical protein
VNSDLRLLREFGEQLRPPPGPPPDSLRSRVLAGAATPRPTEWRAVRPRPARRSWQLTGLSGAVAAALALAVLLWSGGTGPTRHQRAAAPTATRVPTAAQVLRLAADHVALTPRLSARADQFMFSESVTVFDELDPSGWSLAGPQQILVREWRPVGGAGDGLSEDRPVDTPDAPWHREPLPPCRCTSGPGTGDALPTDGTLMYEFLYRAAHDDIPAAYAALIGDDDLAFERAARTLYLAQTAPTVQSAVFAAMNRIPGVGVRADATDVTGRHGVALTRRGTFGTTELIFDATTYRYLGMNLTAVPTRSPGPAGDRSARVMTRQAIQRVAIVDRAGDLP